VNSGTWNSDVDSTDSEAQAYSAWGNVEQTLPQARTSSAAEESGSLGVRCQPQQMPATPRVKHDLSQQHTAQDTEQVAKPPGTAYQAQPSRSSPTHDVREAQPALALRKVFDHGGWSPSSRRKSAASASESTCFPRGEAASPPYSERSVRSGCMSEFWSPERQPAGVDLGISAREHHFIGTPQRVPREHQAGAACQPPKGAMVETTGRSAAASSPLHGHDLVAAAASLQLKRKGPSKWVRRGTLEEVLAGSMANDAEVCTNQLRPTMSSGEAADKHAKSTAAHIQPQQTSDLELSSISSLVSLHETQPAAALREFLECNGWSPSSRRCDEQRLASRRQVGPLSGSDYGRSRVKQPHWVEVPVDSPVCTPSSRRSMSSSRNGGMIEGTDVKCNAQQASQDAAAPTTEITRARQSLRRVAALHSLGMAAQPVRDALNAGRPAPNHPAAREERQTDSRAVVILDIPQRADRDSAEDSSGVMSLADFTRSPSAAANAQMCERRSSATGQLLRAPSQPEAARSPRKLARSTAPAPHVQEQLRLPLAALARAGSQSSPGRGMAQLSGIEEQLGPAELWRSPEHRPELRLNMERLRCQSARSEGSLSGSGTPLTGRGRVLRLSRSGSPSSTDVCDSPSDGYNKQWILERLVEAGALRQLAVSNGKPGGTRGTSLVLADQRHDSSSPVSPRGASLQVPFLGPGVPASWHSARLPPETTQGHPRSSADGPGAVPAESTWPTWLPSSTPPEDSEKQSAPPSPEAWHVAKAAELGRLVQLLSAQGQELDLDALASKLQAGLPVNGPTSASADAGQAGAKSGDGIQEKGSTGPEEAAQCLPSPVPAKPKSPAEPPAAPKSPEKEPGKTSEASPPPLKKGDAAPAPPRKGAGPPSKGGPPPKKGGAPPGKGASEPRKAEVKPKIPLKKLFWTPINVESGGELTIWEKIHENGAQFDTDELETRFAEAAGAFGASPLKRAMSDVGLEKARKRQLFEEKRRRQIWFMLALMPERSQLPGTIAAMDDDVLEPEKVELLLSTLPSPEEEEMVRAALRDTQLAEGEVWDDPEDFVMLITAVPQYAMRMQVWSYLNMFEVTMSRLTGAVDDAFAAADFVQNSARIERLLALILYVGNYLNGGTPRGRADGFDMDTLSKLGKLRSVGEGTLVDFIVGQMESRFPGLLHEMFSRSGEFESIHRARKHKMTELAEELASAARQAEGFLQEMDRCDLGVDEPLARRRGEVAERLEQLAEAGQRFTTWSERYASLCAWFRMGAAKVKPTDEFFGSWDAFLLDVRKALEAHERHRRAQRARDRAGSQQTPRASRRSSREGGLQTPRSAGPPARRQQLARISRVRLSPDAGQAPCRSVPCSPSSRSVGAGYATPVTTPCAADEGVTPCSSTAFLSPKEGSLAASPCAA